MYEKLKRQKGEAFAQAIRNFHNGILEIPDLDVILRHAGQDAEPLFPYLMSLLAANDDTPALDPAPAPNDPFVLLSQAGYEAFHADTLEKQNSIKRYFAPGELLCTFNDAARHENYHIVHAVHRSADQIRRADFEGREERQDEYGTSVISIQMLKTGGFISIKNRYNHTVYGCDNTFGSNPDNIISGLSTALKHHFNVDFSVKQSTLPEGFVLMGSQVFKYHMEDNNIYYGDQAWARDGMIHAVEKSAGDALFDRFLFDNKSKTLKNVDPASFDSFADDFNRCYGGNRSLCIQNGNLTLNGTILIGAERSRIRTLYLPDLTIMNDNCLHSASFLTHFTAPALVTIGNRCLLHVNTLRHFEAPKLTTMGEGCLRHARLLTHFEAPSLITMDESCLHEAHLLAQFIAPELTTMNSYSLANPHALTHFEAPKLTVMGKHCVRHAYSLTHFMVPDLVTMGDFCLRYASLLTHFEAPKLTMMGNHCLDNARALKRFEASALSTMSLNCLYTNFALTYFTAPLLAKMALNHLYRMLTLQNPPQTGSAAASRTPK